MFEEDLFPDEHPYKGWNRASIVFWSRKPYRPAVRAEDLLLPSGLGSLRMLRMCVAMGLMMTLLYVWTALLLVNVFVPLSGAVYGGVIAGAAIGLSLLLYVLGVRETRRDRELAARL